MYLFTQPLAEEIAAADDMAFIERLWEDWSPEYEAAEDLANAKDCLRERPNLSAAIGYYRAALGAPAESCARFESEQRALAETPSQPTLYLHGARDGCIGVDLVQGAESALSPSSRFAIVEGAGHFLHLERPDLVNEEIVAWVDGDR